MDMEIFPLLQMLFLAVALYFLTGVILRRLLLGGSRRRLPFPPGPTGWPVVGCLPLLGPTPHISLTNLGKKYGPLMYLKLGTCNILVASTPDAAKTCLKSLDRQFCNRPRGAGPNYIAYNAEDMVFADVGPRWKLLRKLSNLHMLGTSSFVDWAPLRHREVGLMVRDIRELGARGPVQVLEMVSFALANIIGQKSISQRVFATRGEESNDFKEMITELMRLAGLFNIGDFIPSIEWMDLQGIQGKMKRLHAKFDGLITRMLEDHMKTTAQRKDNPDFFDYVMANNGENEGADLKMVNYKALLLNFFIAGTDTSSCTIEWGMSEILKNPRVLKRAQEEIDQVVGKNRRLQESDIPKLPYLQAICKETFRRHPVVPLNIPRVSGEAFEDNGYHFPENTRLFVNLYAIGRDPSVWGDPLEFRPERFLGEKGSCHVEPWGKDFELIPFGAGRRICSGIRMGLTMVQFILGTLVHSFDWRLQDGVEVGLDESFGLVLWKAVRLEASATPRLNPSAYDIDG